MKIEDKAEHEEQERNDDIEKKTYYTQSDKLDMGNHRATYYKVNIRIYLPKPRPPMKKLRC